MLTDINTHESRSSNRGQGILGPDDVKSSAMGNTQNTAVALASPAMPAQERRRTIVAIVSASIISLVVWGLIVALKIQ
jgi:hypothetical protein